MRLNASRKYLIFLSAHNQLQRDTNKGIISIPPFALSVEKALQEKPLIPGRMRCFSNNQVQWKLFFCVSLCFRNQKKMVRHFSDVPIMGCNDNYRYLCWSKRNVHRWNILGVNHTRISGHTEEIYLFFKRQIPTHFVWDYVYNNPSDQDKEGSLKSKYILPLSGVVLKLQLRK